MSLRARLLLAVGAIALVALVVADIATYQALGAFLNQRVDQNLEQIALQFEHGPAPGQGFDRCLAQPSGAGGPGGAETAPGGGPPSNANATNFVELRTATGAVIEPERSSTTRTATLGVSCRSSCSMRTGSICSTGVR